MEMLGEMSHIFGVKEHYLAKGVPVFLCKNDNNGRISVHPLMGDGQQ